MKVFHYVILEKMRITFCNVTSNRTRGFPFVISRSILYTVPSYTWIHPFSLQIHVYRFHSFQKQSKESGIQLGCTQLFDKQ